MVSVSYAVAPARVSRLNQNSLRFISLKISSASVPWTGSVPLRVASSVESNEAREGFFGCDAFAVVFLISALSCESFILAPVRFETARAWTMAEMGRDVQHLRSVGATMTLQTLLADVPG